MTDRNSPFDPIADDGPSTALVETDGETETTPGLAADLLSTRDPARTNLVAVLYDVSPDEWMKAWLRRIGTRPADLRIVSVGDRTRSATAGARAGPAPELTGGDGATIRPVEDPGNVTELGITINECLTEQGEGERTVLYFDSVSALLQWTSVDYAVQFLQILAGRLAQNDRAGVFLVRPDAHDDDTIRTLESVFDTTVRSGEEPATGGTATETDAVLDVLSDPRRRDAVRILFGEHVLAVDELAARMARGVGRETDGVEASPDEIVTELYHWHLPQLANAGFVEYDRDADTVELADSIDRLRPYLRIAQEE